MSQRPSYLFSSLSVLAFSNYYFAYSLLFAFVFRLKCEWVKLGAIKFLIVLMCCSSVCQKFLATWSDCLKYLRRRFFFVSGNNLFHPCLEKETAKDGLSVAWPEK